MDADYSVELGPKAPALELPWKDPEGRVQYVELRSVSGSGTDQSVARDVERGVERIPEARQFPALRRFLLDANSPQSPWQTVKCDVWSGRDRAEENLYNEGFYAEQLC